MVEVDARGEANATLRGEIRHLEDRFGLNPMARRRLGWEIAPPEGSAKVQPHPDVYRLRAVDPSGGTSPDRLTCDDIGEAE
jgi:hypothetical protein